MPPIVHRANYSVLHSPFDETGMTRPCDCANASSRSAIYTSSPCVCVSHTNPRDVCPHTIVYVEEEAMAFKGAGCLP